MRRTAAGVVLIAAACGRIEFDPAAYCTLHGQRAPYANSDIGGDGASEDTAFVICSAEQLDQIGQREADWDKWFRIGADIDLGRLGREVTMIGTDLTPFSGHIDGGQYTIRGLVLDRTMEDGVGLFRHVGNATLTNVVLDDVDVRGGGRTGGLFAVSFQASPLVSNVRVTGSVRGGGSTGAIAGDAYCDIDCHITFEDVSTSVSIDGGSCTGGIVGEVYDTGSLVPIGATLHRVNTEGTIAGPDSGGIVGCGLGVDIRASTSSAEVNGTGMAGGLVGYTVFSTRSTIADSSASGNISAPLAGGAIGELEGTAIRITASGTVSCSSSYCGGLVGDSLGAITESYATGTVSGADSVGGLAGYASNDIQDSYATGDVSGRDHVGGLVGWYYVGLSTRNYASGTVTGREAVGGLIGRAGAIPANPGEHRDSFSTSRVTGSSSIARVSQTVGWLESLAITSGLVSAAARCTNQTGPCTVFGTEVDLTAQPAYFEAPPSPPLQLWDFDAVWAVQPGALPRLRRAP